MTTVAEPQGFVIDSLSLIRDVRHMQARAAPDLADWLAHLAVAGKADRTLYTYTRQIAPLLRAFPDLEASDFREAHINEMLLTKPVRSRHYTRGILDRWFKWLATPGRDRIPRNPMLLVPPMAKPPRRPSDIYTDAEVALLEALPTPDGPLLTLMFGTGMRKGECRNLRREHIDLNRGRLIVHQGKGIMGGKDRVIPLGILSLQAVAELDLAEGLKPADHLWYTTRGKRRLRRDPVGNSTFDRWWGHPDVGVIARAGVRYLNIHQTRHTYGHRLRELGLDIEERQELMGHESIETTRAFYGRLTVEDVAAKVAEMPL